MAPPFLAASFAEAVVPAVFALVGVLTGYVVTWIGDARRQRGKTIAAGRLVSAELADTGRKLDKLPPGPGARAALAEQLATPSWKEERGNLALGLKPGEWGEIREAFARLAALRLELKNESADVLGVDKRAAGVKEQIEMAQKALAALERREWRGSLLRRS
jgi:hypothetical protein